MIMKRLFIIFTIVLSIITITTKVYSDIPAPPPRPDFVGKVEEMDFKITKSALECLQLALYYEARNDSTTGQQAVGEVILNRVSSKKYPNNICDVVRQSQINKNGKIKLHRCQFSFYCDGKAEIMANKKAAKTALENAKHILQKRNYQPRDKIRGALHYYAKSIKERPRWAKDMNCFPIGKHIFCT